MIKLEPFWLLLSIEAFWTNDARVRIRSLVVLEEYVVKQIWRDNIPIPFDGERGAATEELQYILHVAEL